MNTTQNLQHDRKNAALAPVFIFLMYLGMATPGQGLFPVRWYLPYVTGFLSIILCFFVIGFNRGFRIKISSALKIWFFRLWLPVVIMFLYSMVVNLISPSGLYRYHTRALGLVVYLLLAVIQALLAYMCFGSRAVYYAFIAVGLIYFTSCLVAFKQSGISQFVKMITDSSTVGSVLEMHEVGPIAALFAIFFWYLRRYKKASLNIFLICMFACLFIIICSAKRIVLLAGIIMIVMFELISARKHSIDYMYRLCLIIGVAFIISSLVFVWGIRDGVLDSLLVRFHVNTMSRSQLWGGMKANYRFSPLFLGRGIGFTSKWMDFNWQTLDINGLHGPTGIHSDILKYFIEIGFIGFVLYFGYFLLYLPARLKNRYHNNSFVLFFSVIVYQFLIWFTDNISTYHNFLWIIYLMVFAVVDDNEKMIFHEENH